jgi:hypothetical protein
MKGSPCRIVFIPDITVSPVAKWLDSQGSSKRPKGCMTILQWKLRSWPSIQIPCMKQRLTAGNFRINGVDLAPAEKTIETSARSSICGPKAP